MEREERVSKSGNSSRLLWEKWCSPDQDGNQEVSEKSLDWTDIYLKINMSGFVNKVDMTCEEKRDNEDDSYTYETKDSVS